MRISACVAAGVAGLALGLGALGLGAPAQAATYQTTFTGTALVSERDFSGALSSYESAFTIISKVEVGALPRLNDGGVDYVLGAGGVADPLSVSVEFQFANEYVPTFTLHPLETSGSSFDLAESYDGLPLLGIEGSAGGFDGYSFGIYGFSDAALPGTLDAPTHFQAAHADWVAPSQFTEQVTLPNGATSYYQATFDIDTVDHRILGGVPEPAAWALMILGFGLAGAALRTGRLAERKTVG